MARTAAKLTDTQLTPVKLAVAVSPRDALRKAQIGAARMTLEDAADAAAQYLAAVARGALGRRENIDACKTILDRVGIVPPERKDADKDKDLAEMSGAELLSVLQAAESELAARAKPVNVAPAAGAPGQAAGMFE